MTNRFERSLNEKKPKILTFSKAIKNLDEYVNDMKKRIKKRNEKDYEDLEISLLC